MTRAKTTGQKVRGRRIALGMTQGALATAAGLSMFTVNRVENDQHEPKVATIRKLAAALGCSTNSLL